MLLLLLPLLACKDKDPAPPGDTGGDGGDSGEVEACTVDEVPPEATLRMGWQDDGTFISPGGRLVVPAGPTVVVEGQPIDVVVHPDGVVAYVTVASSDDRDLLVVDLDGLEVLQTIERGDAHPGLALSPDGAFLWAAGGDSEVVERYAVQDDRTLVADGEVDVGGVVSGLAIDPAGGRLWVGDYYDDTVHEIDTESMAVTRSFALSRSTWDLAYLPATDELWSADLSGDGIAVVDLSTGEEVADIQVSTGPAGIVASTDEGTVYAAVSNGDVVAEIDVATHTVTRLAPAVAEGDPVSTANSNLSALWLDEQADRLFVARASDNAVSVLSTADLSFQGAFPVAMYPMAIAQGADGRLVVVEYKGGGIGPEARGAKANQKGTVTVVDVDTLDLAAETDEVDRLFLSPQERFPFECDGFFPVPSRAGQTSPIEHVVLIVNENKTMDCLFGDMGDEVPGLTVDPDYLRWGAELTPNKRALLKQFAVSDNFYTDALESDSGHLMLTATHRTHWVEWMWNDTARNGGSFTWPVDDAAMPEVGNFFSHLLEHDKEIAIYGEIVGLFAKTSDGRQAADFADYDYPGGPAVNYGVTDEEKAEYVVARIEEDGLADFTYILLPNDHGAGTEPGIPTPESMVADTDRGVGLVIDAISHSPQWEQTAVFVLQDDPQGCDDHVDASRSPLFVVSPWAKRGYVSPANADFLSVFATVERILGVPPLGRPDAAAVPLWDMFQPVADTTPFDALERELPPEVNPGDAFGADLSAKLDFRGPDRSPETAALYDAYRLWKMGRLTREEAEARLAQPHGALPDEWWDELEEEDAEETFAFDRGIARWKRYAEARGLPVPEVTWQLDLPDTDPEQWVEPEEDDDDEGGFFGGLWEEEDDE